LINSNDQEYLDYYTKSTGGQLKGSFRIIHNDDSKTISLGDRIDKDEDEDNNDEDSTDDDNEDNDENDGDS